MTDITMSSITIPDVTCLMAPCVTSWYLTHHHPPAQALVQSLISELEADRGSCHFLCKSSDKLQPGSFVALGAIDKGVGMLQVLAKNTPQLRNRFRVELGYEPDQDKDTENHLVTKQWGNWFGDPLVLSYGCTLLVGFAGGRWTANQKK